MKGEIMFKILSSLDEGKDTAIDLLGSYLICGMSYNPNKAFSCAKDFLEIRKGNRHKKIEAREQVRKFYSFVGYLEKDGLVRKEEITGEMKVSITSKGKKKLEYLKTSKTLWFPSNKYPQDVSEDIKKSDNLENEKIVTVVTFDIPEKQRSKRDWLRTALANMNFNMVHKSVWMGGDKIPEKFFKDMKDLKISDYVEIFSIDKAGSLRRLNLGDQKKIQART